MKRKTPDTPPTRNEEGGCTPRPVSKIKYVYPEKLAIGHEPRLQCENFIEYSWDRLPNPYITASKVAAACSSLETFERCEAPCAVSYMGFIFDPDFLNQELPLDGDCLRRQPWLVKVEITWCCITQRNLDILVDLLEACPNIQSVGIRNCHQAIKNGAPPDWGRFINYVKGTTTLRKLVWFSNDIEEGVLTTIHEAIAANRSIIYLELGPQLESYMSTYLRLEWQNSAWCTYILEKNRTLQRVVFSDHLIVPEVVAMFEGVLRHHHSIKAVEFTCKYTDVYTSNYMAVKTIQAVLASHMRYVKLMELKVDDDRLRKWVTETLETRAATYKQTTQNAALILHTHRTLNSGSPLDVLPLEIIYHIIHHLMNDIPPPLKFLY